MDLIKELKKQTDDYQKYRRYQARLTKLKQKPAAQANIKPMQALLAQIHGLLKDMDAQALLIQAHLKQLKKPVKTPGEKLPLTN